MNKIALVTGASKGIGYTLSNMLFNMGYKVIGVYNNTLIDNKDIDAFKCDLSSEEDIIKLFNYVKDKYHKIDVLINGAALSLDNYLEDKTKGEFMKVLEINLVAPFLLIKYFSNIMDNGVIINIASTNGDNTYSSISMDYDASKAGLINLTKNLSSYLTNIKVCAIMPNWVDTDTTLSIDKDYLNNELKRIGQKELIKKEDVCNKIIDIINNDNIKTGSIIRMDDGYEE